MANRLGYSLTRLIRKRAYTGGELVKVDAQIAELKAALASAKRQAKALSQEIAELDAEIQKHSAIDPTDIRAIRANIKHTDLKHGAFKKQVIAILMASTGPVDSIAMCQLLAETLGIPCQTSDEHEFIRRKLGYALHILKGKNVVERLPDAIGSNGIAHGVWRWIGPRPEPQPEHQKESLSGV